MVEIIASTNVEITNVTKVFSAGTQREVVAIDNLSLEIRSGEIVALLGPSGCGKSTLLKIVAGLIMPTDGQVTIGEEPVVEPSSSVGVMFQKPLLFPWLTVLDNILLPHTVHIIRRNVHQEKAMGLIDFV